MDQMISFAEIPSSSMERNVLSTTSMNSLRIGISTIRELNRDLLNSKTRDPKNSIIQFHPIMVTESQKIVWDQSMPSNPNHPKKILIKCIPRTNSS